MVRFFYRLCLLFYVLVRPWHTAEAQEINVIQDLSFGTFAIRENTMPHSITINPDGSTTYDPDIISNVDANRGEYQFTDLPANVTFFVGLSFSNPPSEGGLMIDNQTPLSDGGGPQFTITTLIGEDLSTDNNGDGTLYVGGTLTTSGTGATYNSGSYTGQFDVTLFY